jgi:hypothetical protein
MIWARMLAYITGTVDQELLLTNEYLAAENRILRAKSKADCCYPMPKKLLWLRWPTGSGNIWNIITRSAITRAKTTGSCFLRGRKQEGTKEPCGAENDWEVC